MTRPKTETFTVGWTSMTFMGNLIEECKDNLPTYGDPQRLIEVLQDFMSTHTECQIDVRGSYGDCVMSITGYRQATKDELLDKKNAMAERKRKEKVFKDSRLEDARRLLKEAGEL